MEEHIQLRLISNLLRSTVWITSCLLTVTEIVPHILATSFPVALHWHFCEWRLCENFLFIQLTWCNGIPWSSPTNWWFFNHIHCCPVKTELIDGDDHLKKQLNVLRASVEVSCCLSSSFIVLSPRHCYNGISDDRIQRSYSIRWSNRCLNTIEFASGIQHDCLSFFPSSAQSQRRHTLWHWHIDKLDCAVSLSIPTVKSCNLIRLMPVSDHWSAFLFPWKAVPLFSILKFMS